MNPFEAVVLSVVTGASHNLPFETILKDANNYMEIHAKTAGDILHELSKIYTTPIACNAQPPYELHEKGEKDEKVTPPKRWATKQEIISLKSLVSDPPDDLKIEVNAYNNYIGMTEELVNILDFPRELIPQLNNAEQEAIMKIITSYPDWVSSAEAQEICNYNSKKARERYESLLRQNQVLNEMLAVKPIELIPNDMACINNYNNRINLAYSYFSLACKNGFVRLADYRHLPPIISYPISERGKELGHREQKPNIFEAKMLIDECKNNLVFARPIIQSTWEGDEAWSDCDGDDW